MLRLLVSIGLVAFSYLTALQLSAERAEVQFFNRKYVSFMNVSTRRAGRGRAYTTSMHVISRVPLDDNVTANIILLEQMSSGQYHPTPMQFSVKICEFLDNDSLMGQALKLRLNVSCPIPAGEYHFSNVMIDMTRFPYHLPFAWAHLAATHTRLDVATYYTHTKEYIYNGLDLLLERTTLQYYNRDIFSSVNMTIGRAARGKPYSFNMHYKTLVVLDNKFSVDLMLSKKASLGQYHPTLLQGTAKLCDYFNKEPFLGTAIKKDLNLTCPIPISEYHYRNLLVDLSSFPYHLPFLWSHQVAAHTRLEVGAYHTATRANTINFTVYVTISQKPKLKKQ